MLTGTSALQQLDTSLHHIRNEVNQLDHQLSQLTQQIASNRRQQATLLQTVARVRLQSLQAGKPLELLSHADKQALSLLEQRDQAYTDIENRLEQINRELDSAETERQQQLNDHNTLAQKVVDEESVIQNQLSENAEYLAALATAEQADAVADEAERKADQADEDLASKGEPYQADQLFMYLWERSYRTADYKVYNPLIRFLDSWVAGLIGYSSTRVDYWNIQEIPRRLQRHAQTVREQAEDAIEQITKLEQQALQQAGVSTLQQQLTDSSARLEQQDQRISEIEDVLNKTLQQRGQFAIGEDNYMRECLTTLQQALQNNSLRDLQQLILSTPTQEDDAILGQLQQSNLSHQQYEHDLGDLRRLHNNKLSRLSELETVRRNFKRQQFDDLRSGFVNESLIQSMLQQFLQGLVNGSELWRVIQRNQRHRDVGAWPDYGSGGLGNGSVWGDIWGNSLPGRTRRPQQRRRSSGSWHVPNSRNGGFRLPGTRSGGRTSRRSGGGGFTTGGGF